MMKHSLFLFLMSACLSALFVNAQTPIYPQPERSGQKDDYFGTTIADPYRWMETNDTPELKAWIEAENKITDKYLSSLPQRDTLKKRLEEVADYPKSGLPWFKGGKKFWFYNTGLQNQSVLYMDNQLTLLDPNKLAADGTVALQNVSVSEDGKYIAYSLSRSGSDWNEIYVKETSGDNAVEKETGKSMPDKLEWVKFSQIAWYKDGFYYSRYDAPKGDALTQKNENHKIYYHQLGAKQKDDVLIREDAKNPLRTRRAETDKLQRWLFIEEQESTYGNRYEFKDLSRPDSNFVTMIDDFKSEQGMVAVLDGKFYILTDRDAPNKRLVEVNPAQAAPEHWKDIIPHSDTLLQRVICVGGKFIVTYQKDAAHQVFVYNKAGKQLQEIKLPTYGVASFSGDQDRKDFYYSFSSFLNPMIQFYEPDIDRIGQVEGVETPLNFQTKNYVTERVFYTNPANKKVPIFLTYKKGLKKNGNNPVLLYGYGGFNISLTPNFSPYRLPFLEKGGIYAHCILRGGGEYGEDWHKSGTKTQKQNVFDDFAAAAEFLIKEKYTSPQKLAIQGGSNGGLLVGASVTQRPDLFKAGVAQVGVMDMLRYHKFTIGWAWATDYGTSEESKEMFEYLYRYSPLHNIRKNVEYPALLVTTSDHDDRVVPAHSFKFTAEFQHISTSKNPVYIRIETKAGHGAGKPTSKRIEEQADIWSFLFDQLNI